MKDGREGLCTGLVGGPQLSSYAVANRMNNKVKKCADSVDSESLNIQGWLRNRAGCMSLSSDLALPLLRLFLCPLYTLHIHIHSNGLSTQPTLLR